MYSRMRIKINNPHVIRVNKRDFHDLRRSLKRSLKTKDHYKEGDRILIKEHDGRKYTGHEIMGKIQTIAKDTFSFIKHGTSYDEALEKQNDADSRRHYNFNKYS